MNTSRSSRVRAQKPDLLGRSWPDVGLRLVITLAFGYALSALTAASLSLALPLPPAESVLAATMLSFLVFVTVTIWTFHMQNRRKLIAGLAIPALALTALYLCFS